MVQFKFFKKRTFCSPINRVWKSISFFGGFKEGARSHFFTSFVTFFSGFKFFQICKAVDTQRMRMKSSVEFPSVFCEMREIIQKDLFSFVSLLFIGIFFGELSFKIFEKFFRIKMKQVSHSLKKKKRIKKEKRKKKKTCANGFGLELLQHCYKWRGVQNQ